MAVLLPGKFVYLALPHTATCATMRAIYHGIDGTFVSDVNEVGDVDPERRLEVQGNRFRTHHSTREELEALRPELFKGSEVSFSTVRHPCDLLVTWWLRQRKTIAIRLKVSEPTLLEYIELVEEGTPGGPYIKDGLMYWMETDIYLHYETLQEDLNDFLELHGLPKVELERLNVTKNKRPWLDYYDEGSFDLVRRRFGEEAELFGYLIP